MRAQTNFEDFEKKVDNLQGRQPLWMKTSIEDSPNSWNWTRLNFQLNVYSHKAKNNLKRGMTASSMADDLNI
jgi:hypothetical protein